MGGILVYVLHYEGAFNKNSLGAVSEGAAVEDGPVVLPLSVARDRHPELVEPHLGRVVAAEANGASLYLRIQAAGTAAEAKPGDSIAVAGCCLTATAVADGSLEFDAVPETIARTNLGRLGAGAEVNLEPALRAGEPLGGHFVQGHVDGLGRVRSLEPEGEGARLRLELAPELLRYCVEKGR